jgi:CTD small phosphatase-like protein 2
VYIRPFALECLQRAVQLYKVVIFTAARQTYALEVLKVLDPERKFISYALFRHDCFETADGVFIKDLRILGVDLRQVIIIDNSACAFGFQIDNGVPILPYTGSLEDEELLHLIQYIEAIH